jgi:hypothetical protein
VPEPYDLRALQAFLVDALRGDDPLASSPAQGARAAELIAGNARLSPAEQVDIYREQFFNRHLDCLVEDFPAVLAMLGSEDFEALCRAYLAAHPPRSVSLRYLGADLPTYIAAAWQGEAPARLVSDMARLEWALIDAFDAADLAPLDPSVLQSATPEALDAATLTLDPSLTLLSLAYPVHLLHGPLVDDQHCDAPPPSPTHLAVYRQDDLLDWEPLTPEAFASLGLLGRGLPLAQALDQVAEGLPDERIEAMAADVGGWFRSWLQLGWVRGLAFPENNGS